MRLNFSKSNPFVKNENSLLDAKSTWVLKVEKSKAHQSLVVTIRNLDKEKADFCYHSLAVFSNQGLWVKTANQFLELNYSLYIYIDPLNGTHETLKIDASTFGKLPLMVHIKLGILHLIDRNTDIVLNSILIS